MITRQGKQYVLFSGLLDEAHNRGLRGIDTELIQVPDESNGNVAVVKATVEMEGPEGPRTFGGIGDASPANVGRNIAPHLIRMAETRAKARALRDAVNVGATALEELSDGDDAPPAKAPAPDNHTPPRSQTQPQRPTPVQSPAPQGPRAVEAADGNGQAASGAPGEAAPEEEAPKASRRGARGSQKARKSQVDLLKTLAIEWRGDNGVERLENRIGKPLTDLTRAEADEWIDRLTPEGRE